MTLLGQYQAPPAGSGPSASPGRLSRPVRAPSRLSGPPLPARVPSPDPGPHRPRLGPVVILLGVLSTALIALGTAIPAAPRTATPAAVSAPTAKAAPPAVPGSTVQVVSRASGDGEWVPLGGSVVRSDLDVQLRGNLEEVPAVRYVLRAPNGEVSEADSRGVPFAAALPMQVAPPGPWRLEVRAVAAPEQPLVIERFTVAE